MFVKLAVIVCSLHATLAAYNGPLAGGQPAHLYPAGVDPQSCPNFPNCANPSVAISQGRAYQPQQYQAQPQYQPQQQYQPQYQPQAQYQAQPQQAPISQYNPVLPQQYSPTQQQNLPPQVQEALNRGEYIGDGDYHGEGLAEALAPGYAQQGQARSYAPQQQAYAPQPQTYAPQPHATPAQIPAGVNAQACPNYPFCH